MGQIECSTERIASSPIKNFFKRDYSTVVQQLKILTDKERGAVPLR